MKTTFSYFPGMFENPAPAKYYLKKQNQNYLYGRHVIWYETSLTIYSDIKNNSQRLFFYGFVYSKVTFHSIFLCCFYK